MKYKVGDKVIVKSKTGTISHISNSILMRDKPYWVTTNGWCSDEDLEPISEKPEKTWENLEVGQEIMAAVSKKISIVMGICGKLYFITVPGRPKEIDIVPRTLEDLKILFLLAEPQPEVKDEVEKVCVDVSEIAHKMTEKALTNFVELVKQAIRANYMERGKDICDMIDQLLSKRQSK